MSNPTCSICGKDSTQVMDEFRASKPGVVIIDTNWVGVCPECGKSYCINHATKVPDEKYGEMVPGCPTHLKQLVFSGMNYPAELKYTSTDEWVRVDGDIAILGISYYAQSQLSDVVFAEITVDVNSHVDKNSVVASVESVKAAAEVVTPLSGTVIEINESLSNSFEVINSDPYGDAWMVKIKMDNSSELTGLMDAKTYESFCQGRGH
jgi:glycine cleavage system H protein